MRPTRVVYVENDPALRGIMASIMNASPELDVILATASPAEALAFDALESADVALLDLALGPLEMNGVDLGLALRSKVPYIGIVIHSQYPLEFATERVPRDQLFGWSTLEKSGQMNPADLVALLRSTARGIGQRGHQVGEPAAAAVDERAALDRLSTRQRAVMGLTAAGFSAQQIAEQLSLTYESVRQDLARSYKVLVPMDTPGDDRKTQAVLAFVRLTRDQVWDAP